jgi:HK97 family phage portal protein
VLKAIDLISRARAQKKGTSVGNPLVAALGSLLRPRRDPTTLQQLQAYKGWVYKAANTRAARIAEIDLQVVEVRALKDGTEERVPLPFHPVYDILGRGGRNRRPNPLETTETFKRILEIDLCVTGNCYWVKVRDSSRVTERGGIPREIWRVRPDRMLPVIDLTTGLIAGWGFIPFGSGAKATWPAEDVIQFKYPNPLDPYMGLSPIMANAHAINIDVFNRLYQQRFFEQGALATVVLSSEDNITEADAKEMLEIFKLRHAGEKNAWLPIIAGNGVKVTPITVSNRDLEAIKLFEWSEEDVLSIYGVSKTQLGLAGDVNLSNAHALDVAFNKNVIKPELTLIEHQLEADLLPDYPDRGDDAWLEVDFENPVPGDRDFELRETEALRRLGDMTTNESRERHRLPPFTGRYGDMVQIPFSAVLADPNSDELPSLDDVDEEDDSKDEVDDGEEAPRAVWIREVRAPTEDERTAMWHAWSKRADRWDRRVASLVRREFGRQARIAARLVKQLARSARSIDIEDLVQQAIGQAADDAMRSMFGDVLARLIRREGKLALQQVGSEEAFRWKEVASRYLALVENRIKGINRTTESALRLTLMEGVQSEESIRELAARVRQVFVDADVTRSITIARTEVLGASNFAAVSGYEQGGAKNKGWLSARDDRVRDEHTQAAGADGQIVPINQAFTIGGEPLMYAGDPSGSAWNTIQCRCTVEPR